MRKAAVVCALAAIGGCAYKPGSFAHPQKTFPGERTTVGCLDVAVDRRADQGAWPVLGYTFGNRCDRPTVVDLAWVQVVGRSADGVEVALVPYDPQRELRVLQLDGRTSGAEAITYPADVTLGQVCVDVASLAQETPARWVCLGNPEPFAAAPRQGEGQGEGVVASRLDEASADATTVAMAREPGGAP